MFGAVRPHAGFDLHGYCLCKQGEEAEVNYNVPIVLRSELVFWQAVKVYHTGKECCLYSEGDPATQA